MYLRKAVPNRVIFEELLKTIEGNDIDFLKWAERIRDLAVKPTLLDVLFMHRYACITLNVWKRRNETNKFRILFLDGKEGHPD